MYQITAARIHVRNSKRKREHALYFDAFENETSQIT